jgi:hypothetical protein
MSNRKMPNETKLPAVISDSSFEIVIQNGQSAISNGSDILKYLDRQWSVADVVVAKTKYVVRGYTESVVRFENGTVVETISEKPLPNVDDLNAAIPEKFWSLGPDGNARPPWQRQFAIYLLDMASGYELTFPARSGGAIVAAERLKSAVENKRRFVGEPLWPIVEPESAPYSRRFNKSRPDLKIVGWVNQNGEMLPLDYIGKQRERDPGKRTGKALREELDDEIPW